MSVLLRASLPVRIKITVGPRNRRPFAKAVGLDVPATVLARANPAVQRSPPARVGETLATGPKLEHNTETYPFTRIIRAGQVEGALGVGGATDEQDVECALAGMDAFTSSGTP